MDRLSSRGVLTRRMTKSAVRVAAEALAAGLFAPVAALVHLFVVGPIRPLTRSELGLAEAGAASVARQPA